LTAIYPLVGLGHIVDNIRRTGTVFYRLFILVEYSVANSVSPRHNTPQTQFLPQKSRPRQYHHPYDPVWRRDRNREGGREEEKKGHSCKVRREGSDKIGLSFDADILYSSKKIGSGTHDR
jgi:hypothetical protein